jgi:glycosyltransferase involved in cell wall biosynthesis
MNRIVNWHVLDVRAIWIKEFAAALGKQVSTLGWLPQISAIASLRNDEYEAMNDDPVLPVRRFPLQRGFAKFPMDKIAREGNRIARRIRLRGNDSAESTLICTSPHYAAVAESWRGQIVYYVTDRFIDYGDDPALIKSLDQRMCKVAHLVCPNSQRIANYLTEISHCSAGKSSIIPNATRSENLLSTPKYSAESPSDIADLPRPLAGVIGNLAANTDWELLKGTIQRTPWLSWVFVGPTDMVVDESMQKQAREFLMRHKRRVRFVGAKPYATLKNYARAIDVAVLPYVKREPTYSGSSTRFYEHLAACKPIVATRGVEELLHKEPLLRLADTADELASTLEKLRGAQFRDGQEEERCKASQTETWERRASAMINALSERCGRGREAA